MRVSGAWLSAARRALVDRVIRVDHAGEYGADRIYAGQLAVLGRTAVAPVIKEMWLQEKEHLRVMERFVPKYKVRVTALLPFWNVAGYALGAGSALLGKEAAMACTVAVEEVIGQHYNNQIRELLADEPDEHAELIETLTRLRDDELEHHEKGLEHGAEKATAFPILKATIQSGCHVAIWLSERI